MEPSNPDTLVAVCGYAGDKALIERAMPVHLAHGCPVVVLSPVDSQVKIPEAICKSAGRRAYIGEPSLTRQIKYLKLLLDFPQSYFLINDADSFCVAADLPEELYRSEGTVWSNEVVEPRPHASPYPKIAMQPPYFLSRNAVKEMLSVARQIPEHPITPYVDWFMVAMTCEAGLKHRPFTDLEHPCDYVFRPTGPEEHHCWQQLDYRIRYMGSAFCHPIKTDEQYRLCVEGRKFYERSRV